MIKDYLKFALHSIIQRKIRSWLTMIGIFIGIATVVALISVGQGMEDAISEQFEQMGSDKIIVMPGGGGDITFGAFSSNPLVEEDLEVIDKTEGVDIVAEMYYKNGRVEYKDQIKNTFVVGLPTDDSAEIITDMQGFEAEEGRNLRSGDKNKVTIGWKLWSDDYFEKNIDLRDKIEIEGVKFEVVGLIKRIGNPQDDSQIYIPLDTARELFDDDEIFTIFVQVKRGYTPEEVAEKIKDDLRSSRDEEEGEESFQVQTFEQVLESVTAILDIVRAVLIGIAAISLLVGGIGIMNTVYTSVLERTKEIGIMKSIGAKNSDIMLIFLLESGVYGFVGGVIGISIGILLSLSVEWIASYSLGTDLLKASINFWLIFGALSFSFVIGCLSGILPAKNASSLKPVEALRYE